MPLYDENDEIVYIEYMHVSFVSLWNKVQTSDDSSLVKKKSKALTWAIKQL